MTAIRRSLVLLAVLGCATFAPGHHQRAWAVGQELVTDEPEKLVTDEPEKKKIAPDEVVQSEMTTIRDLTLDVHTLITHRRMPAADARKYHPRIHQSVAKIEAGTMLTGAPRETLAALLQDFLTGAAAVAGVDKSMDPIDGIVLIDDALSRYDDLFEHPGWMPLR
jgi:hypothetical protein